ncbi:hypothetical protein HMPREF1199_01366 [Hoylesella oralis CC98A]|nr:hypothetical protein HMPREF1199_01366 [Hoylesella oralis CC98A]
MVQSCLDLFPFPSSGTFIVIDFYILYSRNCFYPIALVFRYKFISVPLKLGRVKILINQSRKEGIIEFFDIVEFCLIEEIS